MFDPKLKEALGRVQKPGRYTGGEPGSVYKDKEKMDVRFAFCFPDTYEVGMSFLGEKILYELLNSHANWWCERAFMPWLDMKAAGPAPLHHGEQGPADRLRCCGFYPAI